jgi:D-alanyl-D-alanine carboxypeptidase
VAVTRRIFLTGTAAGVAAGALAAGGALAAEGAARAGSLAADAVAAGGADRGSALAAAAPLVASASAADAALDQALTRLVQHSSGPPGAVALVQRGDQKALHRAGTRDLGRNEPIQGSDSMRLASVAKAFSGAVALSAAADGALSLGDTIGKRLPGLPRAWSKVTLRELLQHTSGIPDFSKTEAFRKALLKSLLKAPAPPVLLSYAGTSLNFAPGSKYEYSNSDNIIVGLMVEAATCKSYERQLSERVFGPLGLRHTSLPRGAALPEPFIHGYDVDPPQSPEDVTSVIAAGWSWASGGIVSTPDDANTFIRAYARGATTSSRLHREQLAFRAGSSEPPGPGQNSAGLAIFRYRTKYGTVYGHTGNTLGYTQFIAASADGKRSTIVSVNSQMTPTVHPELFADLRQVYALAVGAALASG